MIPNPHNPTYLLAGTENCIQVWNIENAVTAVRERRSPIEPRRLTHPNLPADAAVDGLIQLDEDHIVSKVAGSGVLFVWKLETALANPEPEAESKLIEPEKILNWSDTDEMYLNLSANMKRNTILAGDANGRIWVYSVRTNI